MYVWVTIYGCVAGCLCVFGGCGCSKTEKVVINVEQFVKTVKKEELQPIK